MLLGRINTVTFSREWKKKKKKVFARTEFLIRGIFPCWFCWMKDDTYALQTDSQSRIFSNFIMNVSKICYAFFFFPFQFQAVSPL